MEVNLLLLLSVLVIGFGIIIFLLNRKIAELKNQSSERAIIEWLKTMQTSLETTNKTINQVLSSNTDRMVQTLQENSKQLNERLDKAAQVIKTVGIEVGQMSEIGRSMKELQELLKSPKLRGNIGEEILKDLLSQIFPQNSFYLQYQFKSGEKVDAAIKTDGGILPIDSKFPMESFQRMVKNNEEAQKEVLKKEFIRDVKKHIDNIAKKYILPDEGTMDFALMYIPSEAIFYEICNLNDILDYARKSRVYLVSPSTLYVHLQTILLSFEGKKIESRSKELFKIIRSLEIEYGKVQENLTILGRHLNNASTQFTNVSMGISQMGNKLTATKILEEKAIEKY
jgi:DNA recombination protein RmuC